MAIMAERAGISRATLAKIERGDSSVSLGGYASVIFVLGLTNRLRDLLDANWKRRLCRSASTCPGSVCQGGAMSSSRQIFVFIALCRIEWKWHKKKR